jgi:hypothetical protein
MSKKMMNKLQLKIDRIFAGSWWFLPVILATQEAEIRRIFMRSQSWA